MSKPFQIGDRVRVYESFKGKTNSFIGIIQLVQPSYLILDIGTYPITVHPKQCRRLVKKK